MKTINTLALVTLSTLLTAPPTQATSEDANQTKRLYDEQCAGCHSASLRGSAHGAALAGKGFIDKWRNETATSLFTLTQTQMPPGAAHTLTPKEHAQLTRYIVEYNKDRLVDSPLLASLGELDGLLTAPEATAAVDSSDVDSSAVDSSAADSSAVEFSGAEAIMNLANNAGGFNNQTIKDFQPVTMAELENPKPADWLNWRRTAQGDGHSPLSDINTENVRELTLSWSMALSSGSSQITPLVRDGVMFLTHPDNKIQAIDGATGSLIWEYRYPYPPGSKLLGGPTRNIALFEDSLFLATYDAALVAIDIKTGTERWRTEKADFRQAFTHSAGPIIADGVVVSGINGCELFTEDGCFITGHDPDTGEELWRTSTLAEPDTEAYASWGEIEPDRRGGGDTWIAGSYDPELNLVIYGTSQPKPWAAVSRGMSVDDAALYTNSTLALDPKTGDIRWYFQHIPGETIDMEVGFERILANIDGQQVVLTAGKDGILWKLDRASGEFIALLETLPQNIFDIDHSTGSLTYRHDIASAQIGTTFTACPGIYGGHNWQSASYNPQSNHLFLPLHQLCSDMTPREVDLGEGGGGYGADVATYPMPGKESAAGKLMAIDAKNLQPLWSIEQEALFLTGALSTDGGLVFIGDLDRYFKAFDQSTGELLWSSRLPAPTHGYPITYEADGRQFVAVPTGIGVFRALTAVIFPDIYQPPGGGGLFVFELPSGP